MSGRYAITVDTSAPAWARRFADDLDAILTRVRLDLKPKRFAKASLPTDDSERVAIVTDESGGIVLAFFDGSDWRRVTDRAVVT